MDITNRQIISDVITELRSVNVDDHISKRFVLSRLRDKASIYIKQDLDSRRLFKITSSWKSVKCLDMYPIPFTECACDIPNCEIVSKSIKKLPAVYDSNYGSLLKVFTINGIREYMRTTLSDYIDIKNRLYADSTKYYWVDGDGHLYIPDSEVEAVLVYGLFKNPKDIDILNNVENAKCISVLDDYFVCPSHLVDIVKQNVINELLKSYKGIVEDQKPNQNSNEKS